MSWPDPTRSSHCQTRPNPSSHFQNPTRPEPAKIRLEAIPILGGNSHKFLFYYTKKGIIIIIIITKIFIKTTSFESNLIFCNVT